MYLGDGRCSFGGCALFLFIESVNKGKKYCLALHSKVQFGGCNCQWDGRMCR